MMKFKSITYSLLFLAQVSFAQEETQVPQNLNLEKAIEIALVNNFDLKTAKNTLEQAKNQNTIGNAGLLPSVSLNGSAEYSIKEGEMEMASPPQTFETKNAETVTYNANVRVDYVLFNGLGKLYTYKKLQQANDLQKTIYKAQMENTILEVSQLYYQVCRAQKSLNLALEAMSISKDRYQRTLDRKVFGQATQLQVLNAEVDMNTDSTRVLQAEQNFLMTVKNLNVSLAIPITSSYDVDDSIEFRNDLSEEQILTGAQSNNSLLLSQQQQEELSKTDIKITSANKYPTLSAYGTYGYYQQDTEASNVTYMQSLGPSAGVSLRFNVFNGKQQRTREKNARLSYLSQQEQSKKVEMQLHGNVSNAFTDYTYKRRIVELQKTNMSQAELNFNKSKEAFELGRISSIEFRTAQQNLQNVSYNYSDAQYNAKISEYNLLRLAGELINEQ